MAQELLDVLAKTGERETLCDSCRSEADGWTMAVDAVDRQPLRTSPRAFSCSKSLTHILRGSNSCSICALLECVAFRRFPAYTKLPAEECDRVFLAFSIEFFEPGPRQDAFEDKREDRRELMRANLSVDVQSAGGDRMAFARFGHRAEDPPHVSTLLDTTEGLDWPEHVPFSSRIRPPRADFRLLRRWMHFCRENHATACGKLNDLQISQIRLIDVVGNRLVLLARPEVSWVALSYCWGAPQEKALKRCNAAIYEQPGGLETTILPPVIADAMEATARLGERYLWVDALCIMQDDDYEKGFYLPLMDVIYSRAIVTLVNAATDSCLAPEGLPGVSSARRSHEPFKFMGACWTESLERTNTPGSGFLGDCTWTTRGWTFQEGLLTPRYLIFTQDQIYWQCELGSWCEASFWEREDDRRVYRHFMSDNLLSSLSTAPTDVEWVQVYLSVISKYLSRKLSCEGDRLHALSGVLNALTRANRQPFFWAMPQGKFEQSLAFHILPSAVPFVAKHLHASVDGEALESPFPSWSWLGWTGDSMNLRNAQSIITTGYLGLQFYSISETGSPFRVDIPQPPPESLEGIRQQIRYPTAATHSWLNSTRQVVLASDLAPSLLANRNLLPSVLCFWSSTAIVDIEALPGLWPGGQIAVKLNDGTTSTSVLWTRREDIVLPLCGKLVVIGAERMRMSHGGHLTLKLMLVDRGGEGGVYRRRHLITDVWEREWEGFQRRSWELVTLV